MDMGAAAGSRRTVFREEIRSAIREAIFSGELKPGDRIIETFWAKELGVSQGPVREAIRDLEAMGLVETVPFKGSRVRLMSGKDVQDNYSVRICLESKSIRDAINKLSDEEMDRLTTQLRTILSEMDQHAHHGDLRSFSDCDAVFHRTIIHATDNQVLLKLWEQCNMRNWFMFSALGNAESLTQLQVGHQCIFDAICARNELEAVSMLEDHLTGLMEGFLKES